MTSRSIHIDDDGTLLTLPSGISQERSGANTEYLLSTRPTGQSRGLFCFITILLSAVIGVLSAIVLQPVLLSVVPTTHEQYVLVLKTFPFLLCAASIYGAYKYIRKNQFSRYTGRHYFFSMLSSLFSMILLIIWLSVGIFAFVFLIALIVFIIGMRTIKMFFRGF